MKDKVIECSNCIINIYRYNITCFPSGKKSTLKGILIKLQISFVNLWYMRVLRGFFLTYFDAYNFGIKCFSKCELKSITVSNPFLEVHILSSLSLESKYEFCFAWSDSVLFSLGLKWRINTSSVIFELKKGTLRAVKREKKH